MESGDITFPKVRQFTNGFAEFADACRAMRSDIAYVARIMQRLRNNNEHGLNNYKPVVLDSVGS